MNRERLAHLTVIVVAGLITYLCACQAGFLSIDDAAMTQNIASNTFTLGSLFLSGASEYYRPLAVISYLANGALTGVDAASFHGVNVLLHLANSLLVYWLALVLLPQSGKREVGALLAALFFLLTPLNSEAVVWVSARPDLMCTFFALLAIILLAKERERASLSSLCCVSAAYLASLCSKEASIALCVVLPSFLLLSKGKEGRKDALLFSCAIGATTACYLFLRSGPDRLFRLLRHTAHTASGAAAGALDQGVGSVLDGVAVRGAEHPPLTDAVGAYGFYLQKLLFPFPLNFTILRYDRTVAFIALGAGVAAGIYLARRHRAALLPLLLIFVGIIPPVLAYVGRIPWTPFGERYLYLPGVGFALLVGLVLTELKGVRPVVVVACLLLLALPTMDRVFLWRDGTAFWNDALKKSPDFAKSYSALGAIAIEEGRYDDAERHIRRAMSLGFDDPVAYRNLGLIYAARKEYGKYEEVMVLGASRSPRPASVYQNMIMTLMCAKDGTPPAARYRKAIKYHLLALSKDPEYLDGYYSVGKLYLALGDLSNAERNLRLYAEKARGGFYRPFALKLLKKIETGEAG